MMSRLGGWDQKKFFWNQIGDSIEKVCPEIQPELNIPAQFDKASWNIFSLGKQAEKARIEFQPSLKSEAGNGFQAEICHVIILLIMLW